MNITFQMVVDQVTSEEFQNLADDLADESRSPSDEDRKEIRREVEIRVRALGFCSHCGELGVKTGHMECQYPQN